MSRIITASIDLTKIDKNRIKRHENGSLYYPIQIFVNDEQDKYHNDVAIRDHLTKDEKERNVKAQYIGNGKTTYNSERNPPPAASRDSSPPSEQPGQATGPKDDLPF